ncbi:MAG: hypothetical protein EOM20_13610 [Spartobacteria bacterium]|nr:hypothetical protein [Spartobacteria bacterium]
MAKNGHFYRFLLENGPFSSNFHFFSLKLTVFSAFFGAKLVRRATCPVARSTAEKTKKIRKNQKFDFLAFQGRFLLKKIARKLITCEAPGVLALSAGI